jgi:hypothetical protein
LRASVKIPFDPGSSIGEGLRDLGRVLMLSQVAMFLSPRFAGQIRERLVSDAQLFQQMVGEGAKAARQNFRIIEPITEIALLRREGEVIRRRRNKMTTAGSFIGVIEDFFGMARLL